MRLTLVAAMFALMPVAAFAEDPAPPAADAAPQAVQADAPASSAAKPKKEKKICRKETVTGSYMPEQWCLTAAEWQKVDALKGHVMDQYGSRGQHRSSTDKGAGH